MWFTTSITIQEMDTWSSETCCRIAALCLEETEQQVTGTPAMT